MQTIERLFKKRTIKEIRQPQLTSEIWYIDRLWRNSPDRIRNHLKDTSIKDESIKSVELTFSLHTPQQLALLINSAKQKNEFPRAIVIPTRTKGETMDGHTMWGDIPIEFAFLVKNTLEELQIPTSVYYFGIEDPITSEMIEEYSKQNFTQEDIVMIS